MKDGKIKSLTTSGILIAIGILLPIAFHAFKLGGQIFLPMHIPILIGGFILPKSLSGMVGLITPFLSFILTSMPPYPSVLTMMAELFIYGFISSLLYNERKLGMYPSLSGALICGCIVSIFANLLILSGLLGKPFNLGKVLTALFITGLPGILIQIIIIPVLVRLVKDMTETIKS